MHYDPLPDLEPPVLNRLLCDELSALLSLIGELGSTELQEAAKARMFSLPERAARVQQGEDHAARV